MITKKFPNRIWKSLMIVFLMLLTSNVRSAQSDFNKLNTISISKEMSIKGLLDFLINETDYQIFYNDNLKGLSNKVNIDVQNATVEKVLSVAFKNQPFEYKITDKSITVRNKNLETAKTTTEQNNRVNGVVYDELKMPMPGVNVQIKGLTAGVSTDFDGKFVIDAEKGSVLVFSYIGYKTTEIVVKDQKSLEVVLQPEANTLEEVIVAGVASGTTKKKMSVSVSKLNSDDISKVPQSSVGSALQGKIAGVNVVSYSGSPGSAPVINLRGVTNINGNTGALVLIDGVILQGSLADINTDDIESIEVVKGAAASSLYGSRAGNGVIVVTSKRGKNNKSDKTSITLRNEFGFQEVSKYLDLSNAHPFALASDYKDYDTFTKYNGVTYPSDYVSGWNPAIVGNRVIKAGAYADQPYRVNNNLQKAFFNNGEYNTYYFGLGHKGEKTNLFLSFENNTNEGIIVETGGYTRSSIRANVDHKISKKLNVSLSNNFIKTKNNFMGGGTGAFFDVLMMEPDVDLFQKNTNGQDYNYFPNHWNTQVSNPLYDLKAKESNSSKDRFLGNYEVKWTIADWVNLEGGYSLENQNYLSTDYTPYGTIVGLDGSTNTLITSKGSLSRYTSQIFNQNYKATLNFSNKWEDLDFKGKLSYLYEDNSFTSFRVSGANFTLPELPSLNYIESGGFSGEDYNEQIEAINYFAIASVVYKNRYIFDALYRYDGSSLFGENERWHGYYRFSGAYRVSEDIKIPYIEELKLRAAIGTSGQRPGYSYQYETYNLTNGIYSPGTLGNNYLKPSNSKETEYGIDMSFLKRFTLEATYSETITTDQFLLAPLAAPYGGFQFQWKNAGTVESQAIEVLLKSQIINKPNVKFDFAVTFDKSESKITKLDIPEYSTGPRSAFKIKEGEEYGVMYGVDFVRTLDQMQSQLAATDDINNYSVNRDGVVVKTADIGTVNEKPFHVLDENGLKKNSKIGNTNALFNLGLNTSFTYKNFSIYTLWKWKNGGDLYNGTAQYLVRDLRHPMMDQTNVPQAEKKTVNYYQALYDAQALNGFWVEDASYVKLNEASIYYNLKGDSLGKANTFIENIKVGVLGRNLFTFTDYTGYDPDAGYDGFLFDNYGYPNFRNFSLSIEIKF
jgi:TonB-linked SusC/RagA family outer membrane protein